MTRLQARKLREAIHVALKDVGDAFNVNFKVKSVKYTQHDVTVKIIGQQRDSEPAIVRDYHAMSVRLNLPELGSVYEIDGRNYKVIGWNRGARKYPVLIEDDEGRGYKISYEQLIQVISGD